MLSRSASPCEDTRLCSRFTRLLASTSRGVRRRGGGGGGGAAAACAPRRPAPSNDLPEVEEVVVGVLAAEACGKSVAANIAVAATANTAARRGLPRFVVVVVVVVVVFVIIVGALFGIKSAVSCLCTVVCG